jgi:hypothetical protein
VAQKAFFENINGKQVFQIVTEPNNPQRKIVIMSHGFRSDSIGPARTFVDFENKLTSNGLSTLRFDQHCSGNSEGDYLDSSFDDWVETTSFLAKKYLALGYKVSLFGQSMGATTTMVVAAKAELRNLIPCIILWVPDPKSTYFAKWNEVGEECGQKYKEAFWKEAKEANFFECLKLYEGGIHLVYGEKDRYISELLRKKVLNEISIKGQPSMILPGQDHSPWDFEIAQKVYKEEITFLKKYLR